MLYYKFTDKVDIRLEDSLLGAVEVGNCRL